MARTIVSRLADASRLTIVYAGLALLPSQPLLGVERCRLLAQLEMQVGLAAGIGSYGTQGLAGADFLPLAYRD